MLDNNNHNHLIFITSAAIAAALTCYAVFVIWRAVHAEDAKFRAVAGSHLEHQMLSAGYTLPIMAYKLGLSDAELGAYFTGRKIIPKMLTLALTQVIDESERDLQMQRNLRILWASPASPEDAIPRPKAKLRMIKGGRARQELSASDPWIDPAA